MKHAGRALFHHIPDLGKVHDLIVLHRDPSGQGETPTFSHYAPVWTRAGSQLFFSAVRHHRGRIRSVASLVGKSQRSVEKRGQGIGSSCGFTKVRPTSLSCSVLGYHRRFGVQCCVYAKDTFVGYSQTFREENAPQGRVLSSEYLHPNDSS